VLNEFQEFIDYISELAHRDSVGLMVILFIFVLVLVGMLVYMIKMVRTTTPQALHENAQATTAKNKDNDNAQQLEDMMQVFRLSMQTVQKQSDTDAKKHTDAERANKESMEQIVEQFKNNNILLVEAIAGLATNTNREGELTRLAISKEIAPLKKALDNNTKVLQALLLFLQGDGPLPPNVTLMATPPKKRASNKKKPPPKENAAKAA